MINNVIFIKHNKEDINVARIPLWCFITKYFSKKKSINKILFKTKDNKPIPYCQADKKTTNNINAALKINDMIYYLTRIRFENLTCHLIDKIKNTLLQIITKNMNII